MLRSFDISLTVSLLGQGMAHQNGPSINFDSFLSSGMGLVLELRYQTCCSC